MTTEYYIDPEDVISDFLRTFMVDPRARAESSESNNFTATASQTVFTITPVTGSVSCITSVTVDAVTKTKWTDYFWDYQNEKITFYTAMTGGEAVVVNFKDGTSSWIYSDKPNTKVGTVAFPRISIFAFAGSGRKIGNFNAPVHSVPALQIDCWTRADQVYTINGNTYSNEYLGRYLGNQVLKAFEDNEAQLFGVFFDYDITGTPRAAPFAPEYLAYHTVVEVVLQGTGVGRIIK